ncbi:hypothetical protein GCM10010518_32390 [Kitasatospora cinereorecta]
MWVGRFSQVQAPPPLRLMGRAPPVYPAETVERERHQPPATERPVPLSTKGARAVSTGEPGRGKQSSTLPSTAGMKAMSKVRTNAPGATSGEGCPRTPNAAEPSLGRLLQTDAGEDAVEPSAIRRSSTLG